MLHSICQQIWKTQQWSQDHCQFFSPIPQKGNAKECSTPAPTPPATTALISHASKGMLKILQVSLQQYVNRELPVVQATFRKGRRTRDQIANICWVIEKAREFQRNTCFCFIDFICCRSQPTAENSSRDGNTRPPDLLPEKPVCRSRNNS